MSRTFHYDDTLGFVRRTLCYDNTLFKEKSQTNADRIRAMTDEELAKLFDSWIQDCDCNDVPCHKSCEENNEKSVSGCINHWLDWLKEEVKDER